MIDSSLVRRLECTYEPSTSSRSGSDHGGFRPRATPGKQTESTELAELAQVGKRFLVELEAAKPTLRMDAVNKVLAVFGKKLGIVDAPRPPARPHKDSTR